MTRNEVYERVNDIFRKIFDDGEITVNDATAAGDIEDWDSLEQINILVAMEKAFSIKFSVDDVSGLENVGQTVDLILKKLAKSDVGGV